MTYEKRNLTVGGLENAARWDAFVDACPEATFFHRAGWKTVIEETFGHRAHFLQVEEHGNLRGVLPLVHVDSVLFGKALVSLPFGVYGGPAAMDDAARAALDRQAVALAEKLGVDHLEYRGRSNHFPERPVKHLYATFRRALDPDPEVNMKAIPRKQRAVVRQGLRAGLDIRFDDDAGPVWDLFAQNVHRHGTPVFSRKLFANLKATFGDDCEFMVLSHQGRDVAGLVSFWFRDEVLPYYAGGTADVRRFSAHDLMYWDLMRRAAERGTKVFDFGRSKAGTGPYAFKKNWGFAPEPLPYSYHLVRGRSVPDLSPLNPKYRAFIGLWKRLPLPVANAVGPVISRNLG